MAVRHIMLKWLAFVLFSIWFAGVGSAYIFSQNLLPIRIYTEAARDTGEGDIIVGKDLRLAISRNHVGPDTVLNPKLALGMTPRNDVKRGQPLSFSNLSRPAKSQATEPNKEVEKRPREALGRSPQAQGPVTPAMLESLKGVSGLLQVKRTSDEITKGGTSLFDLIDSALEFGGTLTKETGSKLDFVNRFLEGFSSKAGEALGTESVAALTKLGGIIFDKLTEDNNEGTTPATQTARTDIMRILYPNVGGYHASEIDEVLDSAIRKVREFASGSKCSVLVSGHTDTVGADTANRDLSRQRAEIVEQRLKESIPGLDTNSEWWGERRLSEWTPDSMNSMVNRRVELALTCDVSGG